MPFVAEVNVEEIEVPLKHVFATAKDKLTRQVSRIIVIQLVLDNGAIAVGEAVPVTYVTGETHESVLQVVNTARIALVGSDVRRLRPIIATLREVFPKSPTALAGIETALYQAHAIASGLSLWQLFGGALVTAETDVTLSIVADAADRAREAAELGFQHFKIKVGSEDLDADFQRLRSIHAVAPSGQFRLDANQAFTPDKALRFIERALSASIPLELVEQPTPKEDLEALEYVAARSPVPIFADEAIKTPEDAQRLVSTTQVHGINVKVMKSGLSGALDIIAIAKAAGRKLMIGCMLETRRGISSSLALALGTGAFDYIDLDSHLLLNEEGDNPYFTQQGPIMSIGG